MATGAVILAAAIAVGLTQKSDKFLEVPDQAHPLAGLVQVPGGKPGKDRGGIYYVDVLVKKASLLQASFSFLRPNGSDLIKQSTFVEPGISYQQQLKLEQQTMKLSQEKAAVVALRALRMNVHVDDAGVRVVDVEPRPGTAAALDPEAHGDGQCAFHGGRHAPHVREIVTADVDVRRDRLDERHR